MAQQSSGFSFLLMVPFLIALVDIGALVVFGLPAFVLAMSVTAGLTTLFLARLAWM